MSMPPAPRQTSAVGIEGAGVSAALSQVGAAASGSTEQDEHTPDGPSEEDPDWERLSLFASAQSSSSGSSASETEGEIPDDREPSQSLTIISDLAHLDTPEALGLTTALATFLGWPSDSMSSVVDLVRAWQDPKAEAPDRSYLDTLEAAWQEFHSRSGHTMTCEQFIDDVWAFGGTVRAMARRRRDVLAIEAKRLAEQRRKREAAESGGEGVSAASPAAPCHQWPLPAHSVLSEEVVEVYMRDHRRAFDHSRQQLLFCDMDSEAGLPNHQVTKRRDNRFNAMLNECFGERKALREVIRAGTFNAAR